MIAAILKEGEKLGGAEANLFVCENISAHRTHYENISKISFSQKHFGASDAKNHTFLQLNFVEGENQSCIKLSKAHRLRKTLCFKSALIHLIFVFLAKMQFRCFILVYQPVIKPQ